MVKPPQKGGFLLEVRSMSCESQIPGNEICDLCLLRKHMHGVSLRPEDARRLKLLVERVPGNAWIGVQAKSAVRCGRNLAIEVAREQG